MNFGCLSFNFENIFTRNRENVEFLLKLIKIKLLPFSSANISIFHDFSFLDKTLFWYMPILFFSFLPAAARYLLTSRACGRGGKFQINLVYHIELEKT